MLIKCLPVGHLMTNCYIVTDETTLECAVIDPGDESNTILYYLEDNHLTCRAILLTHGHYDHTGAVYAVHEETGAPVYMNALDAGTAVAFDSSLPAPAAARILRAAAWRSSCSRWQRSRPCPAIMRSTPATWTAPRSRLSAASTPI